MIEPQIMAQLVRDDLGGVGDPGLVDCAIGGELGIEVHAFFMLFQYPVMATSSVRPSLKVLRMEFNSLWAPAPYARPYLPGSTTSKLSIWNSILHWAQVEVIAATFLAACSFELTALLEASV